MKIGLSFINANNHGDQIIFYTSKYCLEKSLQANGITDYEIVPVDICLADGRTPGVKKLSAAEKAKRAEELEKKMEVLEKKIAAAPTDEEKFDLIHEKWHNMPYYERFMVTEYQKLEGIDYFVFSGGGMVKFHAQHYHFMTDMITEYCEERNIPVFLIGVGVEGFDEENPECRLLTRAVNRKCVKYFSVRDDYETVVNNFIRSPHVEVEHTCDPAFWTQERYRIRIPEKKDKVVGINGIRPAIWQDYMYEVDQQELCDTYRDLILKLVDNGYKVELFSNGVASDTSFLKELIKMYPELQELQDKKKLNTFFPTQPRRLIKRIAEYDRFMAVRLHASIVGTSMSIPNVSLVWCIKQILFGEQTGTLDNFIMKENFNADYIYDKLVNAQPYVVPEEYKYSVYNGIDRQVKKYFKKES